MEEPAPPERKRFGLVRLLGLTLAAVVVLGGVGAGAVYLYRSVARPTLAGWGGTILVYEVDADKAPEGKFAELPAALLRRIDPTGRWGVTVEPVGDNRVQIGIPRAFGHEEHLREIKDSIGMTCTLEFRIEANERDDKPALEAARAALERDAWPPEHRALRSKELQARAERGQPPPAPGGLFEWHNHETGEAARWGEAAYQWVELDKGARATLELRASNGSESENGKLAAKAREAGQTFVLGNGSGVLFYNRDCVNLWMPPAERQAKTFDVFVLTRVPELDERVGGTNLVNVDAGQDSNGVPSITFEFNKHGAELFYQLTEKNKPSGVPPFHRYLAILLDDRVVSAPSLNEPIRKRGQITGNFTQAEVDGHVRLLRAGALPVRLQRLPVSEETVEPER